MTSIGSPAKKENQNARRLERLQQNWLQQFCFVAKRIVAVACNNSVVTISFCGKTIVANACNNFGVTILFCYKTIVANACPIF